MSSPLTPHHLQIAAALRAKLDDAKGTAPLTMWWGTYAVAPSGSPSTIGVMIGGSAVVTQVRYDATLSASVGNTVWGLAVGSDYIAIGHLQP